MRMLRAAENADIAAMFAEFAASRPVGALAKVTYARLRALLEEDAGYFKEANYDAVVTLYAVAGYFGIRRNGNAEEGQISLVNAVSDCFDRGMALWDASAENPPKKRPEHVCVYAIALMVSAARFCDTVAKDENAQDLRETLYLADDCQLKNACGNLLTAGGKAVAKKLADAEKAADELEPALADSYRKTLDALKPKGFFSGLFRKK